MNHHMVKKIFSRIFFGLMGWHELVTVASRVKCVICVAPHTSNWDFIIGKLYYYAKGLHAGFLMKKEWFVGPLGWLFRSMGGIPVERSKHTSLTDQLAQLAAKKPHFTLAVTPEGTRSLVKQWKRGFYFIALKAGIPIQLFAIDYKNKQIVCTKEIIPDGNVEEQMQEIMHYYAQFASSARHPEKFCVESTSPSKDES